MSTEQFPPVKAPSSYDGDYRMTVKPRRETSWDDQALAIGCLVTAGLVVFVMAIGIVAFAVTR